VVQETKAVIRKKILNLLKSQEEEDKRKNSLIILERLCKLPEFATAHRILFYASFDGEVETFEMMKQAQKLGKKVALPIILWENKTIVPALVNDLQEDLEPGKYGIKQPKETMKRISDYNEIDMIVVPGVAFDTNRNRLGRGAGYYDRFLETVPSSVFRVGLAFDFQIIDTFPKEQNDIPVDCVITN